MPHEQDGFTGLESDETYVGTVNWFNARHPKGGRGYITPDAGQDLPAEALGAEGDVFVFFNDIAIDGFKGLFSGNRVEFELRPGHGDPDRLQAANVIPLSTYDE